MAALVWVVVPPCCHSVMWSISHSRAGWSQPGWRQVRSRAWMAWRSAPVKSRVERP